eukprot:SAG22_NODE_6333_length_869_cov_1.203896_1_plen_229_part_01
MPTARKVVRAVWLASLALAGLDLLAGQADERERRWCLYESDGVCDEGVDCNWGTDLADCSPGGRVVTAVPLGVVGPGRLVDGLLETEWSSPGCGAGWCAANGTQLITVDLAEPTCVTSVTVRWAGQNSATGYTIAASLDDAAYTTVRSISGYSASIANRMDRTAAAFNRTRFLRFTLTEAGGAFYAIRELQWEADEAVCDRQRRCGTVTDCDGCVAAGCGWCLGVDATE